MTNTSDTRPRHNYRLSTGDVVAIIFDHADVIPETTTYQLADGAIVEAVLVGSPQDRTRYTLVRSQCSRCGRDVGVKEDGTLNEHGTVDGGRCSIIYIHSPRGVRVALSYSKNETLKGEVLDTSRAHGWAYASVRNDDGSPTRIVIASRSPMKLGSTVADWFVTP